MRASKGESSKDQRAQTESDGFVNVVAGPPHAFAMTCLVALAHAALIVLALPPIDWWVLAFFAPAPLAWMALRARTSPRAIMVTLFTQWLMWLWLLRWIVPVTAVGYPFLALYQSIYGCLFVWAIRRINRHHALRSVPMTFVLPIVWTGIEFLRGEVAFNGYPWYLLAHPLIAFPAFVQSADLFGTYFISFIASMPAGFIVGVMLQASRCTASNDSDIARASARRFITFASIIVVTWLANLFYGCWRMRQTDQLSTGPRILAIQTNLPQDNKVGWSPEAQERDLPQFIALTRRAFEHTVPKPDLIVWPETMVPGVGFDPHTQQDVWRFGPRFDHYVKWPRALVALSSELATPIVVGSEAWVNTSIVPEEGGKTVRLQHEFTYNSAYLVQGDPPYQRYDKFFLTPFGETMPYISNWPWLEHQMLALGAGGMKFDLDSNPVINLLRLSYGTQQSPGAASAPASPSSGHSVSLATPICFEDTVGRFCRRMVYRQGVKQADIFVNISNDGWFTFSGADRKLHAQIARFRCIENRVPMIRSVNTGVSVSIDSCGRLIGRVGQGEYGTPATEGWVVDDVKLDSRQSLYGRVGELWPWLCLAASMIAVAWSFTAARKDRLT